MSFTAPGGASALGPLLARHLARSSRHLRYIYTPITAPRGPQSLHRRRPTSLLATSRPESATGPPAASSSGGAPSRPLRAPARQWVSAAEEPSDARGGPPGSRRSRGGGLRLLHTHNKEATAPPPKETHEALLQQSAAGAETQLTATIIEVRLRDRGTL